jgi:hypothetical protein
VRKSLVIAFAGVFLAAGCGSSTTSPTITPSTPSKAETKQNQNAAQFVVRIQAELKQGKFAQAWRTLHPAEKRAVSAQRLASCYPRNQFPGTVTFRARDVADVRWTVPGTGDTTDAKEITIAVTSPGQPSQSFKQHVVRSGGGWAWMLSSAYFTRAKSGTC